MRLGIGMTHGQAERLLRNVGLSISNNEVYDFARRRTMTGDPFVEGVWRGSVYLGALEKNTMYEKPYPFHWTNGYVYTVRPWMHVFGDILSSLVKMGETDRARKLRREMTRGGWRIRERIPGLN